MNVTEATGALERLVAGELSAVILQGGDYYVQFADEGGGRVLAEAVGDDNLEERLTPDQLRKLFDLGFRPPGRNGAGNHQVRLELGARELATLGLETMLTVYGVAPEDVSLQEI